MTADNIQQGPTTDMNARLKYFAAKSPFKQLVQSSEIAGPITHLAGEEPEHMTSTSLTLDGSFTLCETSAKRLL